MRTLLHLFLCFMFTSSLFSHAAGIQIGRTRIVYNADKKEISLPLVNKDQALPWLVQSWTVTEDGKTRGPFIITPPLFRLDPQKEQSLRIAWNGTALPDDRETIFYMNIRTIPATAKEDSDKNVMRLIYKTRLKLFWRPGHLKGTPDDACKNLRFTRRNSMLLIVNDGAYYTTFDSLHVGNRSLDKADMVAPASTTSVELPNATVGSRVTWRCITDYGNASEQYASTLMQD